MTVPDFGDIGKNAWDIFKTGYYYGIGIFNVSVTNKSDKNVQLNSKYNLNCDSSKADVNAEVQLILEKLGSLKHKWSSDGTIIMEYGADGIKPIEGLSLTTGVSHNPSSTISQLKFGAKFKNQLVNLGCSVSNALDKNFRLTGAAVLGIKNLYFGYQTGYDTEMGSMTMNDVGISYCYENVGINLRASTIPDESGASVLYKVNENWDTVINGIYANRDDRHDWTFGVGTRLRIDEKMMVRLKLNMDHQMGASIQQKIYDFIKLTLSFNIDLNDLSRGDHKVGLAIDIDDCSGE